MTELRYREDVVVAPGCRHVAAIRTSLRYSRNRPHDVAAAHHLDACVMLFAILHRAAIGTMSSATPDH